MLARSLLFAALNISVSAAEVGPIGHAAVDWIAVSDKCPPGQSMQTAIRMVIEDGWHTYWENPGDGGMKTSFEWKLPAGWKVGEPAHPLPGRFMTSGLTAFGYKGTVLVPVTVNSPPDFVGTAELRAVVSWLACHDDACVPGHAELVLRISAGNLADTAAANTVRDALQKIPRPVASDVRMTVEDQGSSMRLTIESPARKPLDLAGREVFPATPQVLAAAAEIRFVPDGSKWTASVLKSEYAKAPIGQLTLVFSGKGADPPIEITWSAP